MSKNNTLSTWALALLPVLDNLQCPGDEHIKTGYLWRCEKFGNRILIEIYKLAENSVSRWEKIATIDLSDMPEQYQRFVGRMPDLDMDALTGELL